VKIARVDERAVDVKEDGVERSCIESSGSLLTGWPAYRHMS
jgi:hypothetical protein